MKDIQLGFGPSPRPQYVYIGQDKSPTGWYFWDGASETAKVIEDTALTGYITSVETDTRTFKEKDNKKLLVHVSAGPRNYIIQAGFYTAFARTLLAALARLNREHLQKPLSIEPQPGKEKTVFCNLYNAENGGRIPCQYPPTEAVVDRLFNRVCSLFAPAEDCSDVVPDPAVAGKA